MTARGDVTLASLLAAVHAAPDDDAPRLVYADALLERGDADATARGELITLQCRGDATSEHRTRARQIIDERGRGWHAPIGEIAAYLRYERGFLAACRIAESATVARIRAMAGHRAWATLSALRGSLVLGLDPALRALRTLWFEPAVAAREGLDLEDAWRDLLVTTPRPLTGLHITVAADAAAQLAALADAAALPALRSLEVTMTAPTGEHAHALLRAPVARRVETFALRVPGRATLRSRERQARIEIDLSRASGHAGIAAVIELLRALPPCVTELCVRLPDEDDADGGARSAIAAAAPVPPAFDRTRRAMFYRCPQCGSTDAGRDPSRGPPTINILACLACSYWESENELDDGWDGDRELVLGTDIPAFVPVGLD